MGKHFVMVQRVLYIKSISFLKKHPAILSRCFCLCFLIISAKDIATAQTSSVQLLKQLSVEDLMNVEVTTVSRHPEKLVEAASAVQVITRKEIISSGAKTLVEALRLATNLQVAQVNSSQWAVSARGFNNVLANKLLVLIDGRTVYTPLYAGVFWDVQNILLEDVDRIEVISGPGGTLWGANAVNGVINIITKNAKDTKGFFAEAATGTAFPAMGSLRYGNKITEKLHYRIYGTGFKMGAVVDTNEQSAKDEWSMIQGGLRMDWDVRQKDKLSLQANIYDGKPNPDAADKPVIARGNNIVARWMQETSAACDFQLQAYYDHTWRDFNNGFTEDLKTYDADWQNTWNIGMRNRITYGLNFRLMDHVVTNLPLFTFSPDHKTLYLYSAFMQDKFMVVDQKLYVTAGLKVEHNSYTQFEYQPNARITWTPSDRHTVWAAASRAVRTPARIDRDFALYIAPGIPLLAGSDSFVSEDMLSYELGWRLQPAVNSTLSLASFYNIYDNIRSAEPGPPPFNIPITFANGVKGTSYGIEISSTNKITDWLSLKGGYTFLKKDLSVKSGSMDLNHATAESNDPEHQFLLQSDLTFAHRFELGAVFRYIDKLPKPYVPSYEELDLRLSCRLTNAIEVVVTGQNLLDSSHAEFIASTPPRETERSVYGKVIVRF
jgi:iron complex outermembrane receptor protein